MIWTGKIPDLGGREGGASNKKIKKKGVGVKREIRRNSRDKAAGSALEKIP